MKPNGCSPEQPANLSFPMKTFTTVLLLLAFVLGFARAVDTGAPSASPPGRPRLVDLGADKCIPCKMMAPILAELTKEYAGQLDVVFIDVWKKPAEGKAYAIQVIPTQIFYDATGKERFRHEGFMAKKDILAKWRELGFALQMPDAGKKT
jgi:thioredoxin 1